MDDTKTPAVQLVGGPLHNVTLHIDDDEERYLAPVSGGTTVAVYCRNEKGKAEFIFAGYTG